MSPDPIRAALERLVELDDGCTADHWYAAIVAARAALAAEPVGDGPSDAMQRLLAAPMDARGYVDLRRPAAPPAPEPGGGGGVGAQPA